MARYYPYFLLGNYIKHFKLHELAFGSSGVFCFAALFWACSSLLAFKYSEYLISGAAIFVIMNLCKKMDEANCKFKNFFVYLGKNTLYIYLFHYFALQLMKTECFTPFLCEHSNFVIDLLLAAVPTTIAVLFSIGMKTIVQRESLLMKIVFGK